MTVSLSYILWLENGLELMVEGDIAAFPGLKNERGRLRRY